MQRQRWRWESDDLGGGQQPTPLRRRTEDKRQDTLDGLFSFCQVLPRESAHRRKPEYISHYLMSPSFGLLRPGGLDLFLTAAQL